MSLTATKNNKIKKSTKKVISRKYIRVPVDAKVDRLLKVIQEDNPLFTETDAILYVLGKSIKEQYRDKFIDNDIFDWIRTAHKDTPEYTQDEIFDILRKNQLMK